MDPPEQSGSNNNNLRPISLQRSGYSHFEFCMHLLDSQCWSPISRLISKYENDKVTKNNLFSLYVTFQSYFNIHSTKFIKSLVILLEMSGIHIHPWTQYSLSLTFNTRLKKEIIIQAVYPANGTKMNSQGMIIHTVKQQWIEQRC